MTHGLSEQQLRTIGGILAPYAEQIDGVYLFGSRATGTYRQNSDIDLVLRGRVSQKTVDRLFTLFQESSLPVSVDVRNYDDTTSLPLRRQMDQVMRLLFTRQDLEEKSPGHHACL